MNLVDDTPIVPGDVHPAFAEAEAARQVLTDAEDDLRNYELLVEPIHSNAGNLGAGAMPGSAASATNTSVPEHTAYERTARSESPVGESQYDALGSHGGGGAVQAPYPVTETERLEGQQQTPRQESATVV